MGKRNRSTQAEPRQYIRRLAISMMGELRVEDNHYVTDYEVPRLLWMQYSEHVFGKLQRMNPETLGRIACQGLAVAPRGLLNGRTPMMAVLTSWTFGEPADGRYLVERQAAVVIIAEIADIILERRRAREHVLDELAGDAGFVP